MAMTKKEILLVALVVVLGGLYARYFTDWFAPKVIRVDHSLRPLREAWTLHGQRIDPGGEQANTVSFTFRKEYRLTLVKVVPVAEYQTNKNVHPLWYLVSKKGSSPTAGFSYGTPVEGMTSPELGALAEPLQPGVAYRLFVNAGSFEGTNDFTIPLTSASRR
jgi:hypothetical protein